jgi:intracellular sulfur oxidation DsrE/DsrF family protein
VNCTETHRLLNAYIDGELELQGALAVEAHLDGCARCRAASQSAQALRAAMARACEPAVAPARLRHAVRAGLSAAAAAPQRTRVAWLAAAPGVAALLLAGWLLLAQPWNSHRPAVAIDAARVVYHIAGSDNIDASLRTLRNHLDATPDLHVVVVAHNDGIRFLLDGARDGSGQPYVATVRELRGRGVEFRVCANTLTRREIDKNAVVSEAVLVPSGIAEISRLQGREGYTYLRL